MAKVNKRKKRSPEKIAKKLNRIGFVDEKLKQKIDKIIKSNGKKYIKTWSRRSTVRPEFIGFTFDVHNGKGFTTVKVNNENMIGHKLGEFAPTRTFKAHPGNNAEDRVKNANAAIEKDKAAKSVNK